MDGLILFSRSKSHRGIFTNSKRGTELQDVTFWQKYSEFETSVGSRGGWNLIEFRQWKIQIQKFFALFEIKFLHKPCGKK